MPIHDKARTLLRDLCGSVRSALQNGVSGASDVGDIVGCGKS
jgi:hypothetical protein